MLRDNRGMTLIELVISMFLLAIVSLALVQSALVAMKTNFQNEMRDEAVRVAEDRMSQLRNDPFAAGEMQVNSPPGNGVVELPPVTRNIRAAACQFTIQRQISAIDINNRQVTLKVTWTYRNVQYSHSVSTILRTQ